MLLLAVHALAGPGDAEAPAAAAGGGAEPGTTRAASPTEELALVEADLKTHPADLGLRLRRQDLLIAVGRRADAIKEAHAGFQASPDDPAACVLQARFLGTSAAVDLYEKALKASPKLEIAYRALARLYESQGRHDRGAEVMGRAVEAVPSAAAMNYRGWLQERAGQGTEAAVSYRSAIEADPKCFLARENLALLLASGEEKAEALSVAKALAAIAPERASSWIVLGLVRARRKETREAAAAYEQALAVSPAERIALLELVRAYRRLERFDLADAALRKAEEIAPDDASVVVQRGLLDLDRGNHKSAESTLARAARLDPTDPRPRYFLAQALDRQGRAEDALREYRRAAALGKDEGLYHLSLGYACQKGDRLTEALRSFERAADLMPGDVRALAGQGVVLQKMRKAKDAVARFEKVVERDPKNAEAHVLLGILYADALRDRKKAEEHFKKYLEHGGAAANIRLWYTPPKDGEDGKASK
jgi:tetratricopeptide (TPR) repeat protein